MPASGARTRRFGSSMPPRVQGVSSDPLIARKRLAALRRLEELYEVAGRVLEQDLGSPRAGHDLVAEGQARRAQPVDLGLYVIDHELDPVPPTRFGLGSV